jgi:hypothetical protein
MQNGILLLDIAFKDLTSSKLLFDRELYPQSIFYMQQAVEKSIKQLGIYNGVVKPSELQKDIGHKAEKIFKRVVGQVKHITGDSDTGINSSYNELKQLQKKAGLAEVKEVVIKALEDNMQLEFPSAIIELVIEMIIKNQAPDFYEKAARNKQIDEEFRNMKKNFIKYFPAYIKSVMILFHLNLILSEYVSTVRYPVGIEFENPDLVFNTDHPLVQLMPIFSEHCSYAIKGISDFQLMIKF